MKRTTILWSGLLLVTVSLILSACLPTPEPIILPTITPTVTVTPSPTILWFPPTATNTPKPTLDIEPTPTIAPEFGPVLLRDDFDTPEIWSNPLTSSGRVSVGSGELTITLTEPEAYLFTTRSEPNLRDFYLEVNLHASLCSGEDQYGIFFRATPPSAYYRLGLSCDGRIRLDRIMGGTASSPQPWLRTASLPPGPMITSKIGILARGETFQVFINDDFQFEAKDPMLAGGVVGFFVRSAGETAMTVSASDLVVYSIPAGETDP